MTPSRPALDSLHTAWLAWIVLILTLGGVVLWADHAHRLIQDRKRIDLERESAGMAMQLEERMRAYGQVLHGAAAFLEASPMVTREQWAAYTRSTRLRERFPGILGLGFATYLSEQDVPAFEAGMGARGVDRFAIHPPGKRETHAPVTFLEPTAGRNASAIGFDMYSDPARREAMERARDSGEPAITARVRIQAAGQTDRSGLLHYLPVYKPGRSVSSVAERRQALLGWVYIRYFTDDLLAGIRGGIGPHLHVYDGAQITPQSLLFDSAGHEELDDLDWSERQLARAIAVGGHTWNLVVRPSAEEKSRLPTQPVLIVVLGSIAALLLFWMVRLSARTHAHARALAREMTAQLHEKRHELESARAMLDAVFDAVPVPIAVKDQDGRFLLSNPANQALNGLSASETIGRTDRDLFFGKQLDSILGEDAQARAAAGVVTFDVAFNSANGTVHSVVKHKRGFDMPDGRRGVVAVMLDVTPLRSATAELERSRSFLDMVLETISNPVFVKDRAHRWIVHNQASCAFLGVERQSLVGKSDFDVFPEEQAQRLWAQDDQVMSTGEQIEIEEPFITAAGEKRWVLKTKRRATLADGSACIVGSITDITDIKRAEAEAHGAQQMVDAVLNASPSPLWVKDERGRFLLVNDAGCRLLARPREALLGRSAEELYAPEIAARIAAQDVDALDGESERSSEGLLHSADGEERWGTQHKRAITLPDGRRVVIVSVNDQTAQHAAQLEVERSRQFLEAILDAAPLPMFVKDAQHRFVVVNEAFSRQVKRDAASVIGRTDAEFSPRDWAAANLAQDEAALASDYAMNWEDTLIGFDGSDRWVSRTKRGVRLADGSRYVVGVNVDITDTKRAVLAAERSRSFLDALVAALPQPVFVKDRLHRYVILNDAFCQIVGKQRSDLLGRSDFDAFTHDVATSNWEEDDVVFDTGERYAGVNAFRTLEGRAGWLYTTKVLLRLAEGTEYLVGASTDITRQKEDALEVERSKAFLDAVLNAMPGAVVVKDIQRRVVVANDALCRAMQRTREELIGTRLEDLLSAEAKALIERQDDEAFGGSGVMSFEHKPYAPGYEARWILKTKHAVTLADGSRYLVGVNTDVSALKRAEQALRDTQERLRVLNVISGAMARMLDLDEVRRLAVHALSRSFQQLRVSIASVDECGQAKVSASAGCEMLPGLIGRSLHLAGVPVLFDRLRAGNLLIREDLGSESDLAPLLTELAHGVVGATLHAPLRLGARLVGMLWVDAPAARAWTEHEQRTLAEAADYLVIALDSARIEQARQNAETELRRHRDNLQELVDERTHELREAMQTAERANRAKSEFLTNMSHELRTPMHAILSFARLGIEKIAQGRMEAHKLQQYFGRIDQSGERLLALLNDLLDLSKLESGRMDYVFGAHEVMGVLRAAVQEFGALAASAGVQIDLQGGAAGAALAHIDPGRLGQVVRNLLSNAIKFTPAGGIVRIDLREAAASADMQAGRVVQIRVSDSGVGIPRHELDAIFHKFVQSSTTRSNAGGTGLGLAICREIVHAHGGQIWVESELGRGSTFIVALPLSETSSAAADEESPRPEMAEPSAEGA